MARTSLMVPVLSCLAVCGGLVSCSGKIDITDEYVVGLAKPHIEANPPPPGFVPVVEWNPGYVDEYFIYLFYIPERYVNLKQVDGVYLHNWALAKEYNYNHGIEHMARPAAEDEDPESVPTLPNASPTYDFNTGENIFIQVLYREFRSDSQMGDHMIGMAESIDEGPSFHPNQRFEMEDVTIDGTVGWLAYAQRLPSKGINYATPGANISASAWNQTWVMRFTWNKFYRLEDSRSEEEFLERVEEARQILASFKVLEHVKNK